ncbi:MAG: S8 family serine peptidase [Bacteroidota bacterium]
MKKASFFIFLFCIGFVGFSQNNYCVFFANKQGSTFKPDTYFDAKALERKIMFGVSLNDSTDYPVNNSYLSEVEKRVQSLGIASRWFNCSYVIASPAQIEEVKKLSFVSKIILINTHGVMASYKQDTIKVDNTANGIAKRQLMRMQGDLFAKKGITGKGIRIAIFDGGFPEVNTHKAFDYIRKENRIIKTFDFVKKKDFVYSYNSHGLSTFSNVAGIVDDVNLGLATGAEFLLARTEVNTEPFAEEQYWLAAAEWADKNGAHIISSSLGYTSDRYFPEQMDGEHSLVVKAANMAATKGMLVINAMGNDGDSNWKVVGTPADADSVLSVGGIDPDSDMHISFSSYGPTKDGRLKPNVCSFGKATVACLKGGIEVAYGTSFSTPLIAGFAACAWQTKMGTNNMVMKSEIEHSGDLFPYYDYAHGYGVPQASYFIDKPAIKKEEFFKFKVENEMLKIIYTQPLDSVQVVYHRTNELSTDTTDYDNAAITEYNPNHYLYFHISKPDGKLTRYGVVFVFTENPLSIPLNEIPIGYTLRIAYKDGFQEWVKQ